MATITVTTARNLAQAEVAAIQKQLNEHFDTDVTLKFQVDSSIIGGIRLRAGTTEYDATIVSKLQTIKQRLLRL
jgi:F-type H+-transporting ATPase subunit delta